MKKITIHNILSNKNTSSLNVIYNGHQSCSFTLNNSEAEYIEQYLTQNIETRQDTPYFDTYFYEKTQELIYSRGLFLSEMIRASFTDKNTNIDFVESFLEVFGGELIFSHCWESLCTENNSLPYATYSPVIRIVQNTKPLCDKFVNSDNYIGVLCISSRINDLKDLHPRAISREIYLAIKFLKKKFYSTQYHMALLVFYLVYLIQRSVYTMYYISMLMEFY
jgi:hypothetical protein